MTNQQEWQQENSLRAFPFSESKNNVDDPWKLPSGFIVDLRFFPDQYTERSIYLSEVAFSPSEDTYSLKFSYKADDFSEALSFSVSRLNGGESRVGSKIAISGQGENPYAVCVFAPGKLWDPIVDEATNQEYFWITDAATQSELVEGVYVKRFEYEQSALDDSIVNPGPKTIRRVFIDPVPTNDVIVPPPLTKDQWGREVEQRFIAGHNIRFDKDGEYIVVNAIGGAGDGYPPKDDSNVLRFINTVGASPDGHTVKLNTLDCLNKVDKPRLVEPISSVSTVDDLPSSNNKRGDAYYVESEDNAIYDWDGSQWKLREVSAIDHTLQIFSDCLPCCGCEAYRHVSAAITRRSTMLRELSEKLAEMVNANVGLYNSAVRRINENRQPIVRARNIRVTPSSFKVSIQNVCNVPVYAHVAVSVVSGIGVFSQDFSIIDTPEYSEKHLYTQNFSDLQAFPLVNTPKDYLNEEVELPSGQTVVFVVGEGSTMIDNERVLLPIPPGSHTELTFKYSGPIFDLRDSEIVIRTEANGIYGGALDGNGLWVGTYGCKKDVYVVKCVEGAPYVSNNCGVETTTTTYKMVEVPTEES